MAQITIDFYDLLRKGGNLLQYKLNNRIKRNLNSRSIINLAQSRIDPLPKKIQQLQQYTEQITTLLNVPTKGDISNATQLIIQSEEKIDRLDDQLFTLSTIIDEIKQEIEVLTKNPEMSSTLEISPLQATISEQEDTIASLQQQLQQATTQIEEYKAAQSNDEAQGI